MANKRGPKGSIYCKLGPEMRRVADKSFNELSARMPKRLKRGEPVPPTVHEETPSGAASGVIAQTKK
jgi:hypothetical protein